MNSGLSKKQREKWADNICFMQSLRQKAIFCVSSQLEAKLAERGGAGGVIVVDAEHPIETEQQENIESCVASADAVRDVLDSVAIPVFVRIHGGSEVESDAADKMRVDGVEETETVDAGYADQVNKHKRSRPYICGASSLAEALWRVREGAGAICVRGSADEERANPAQAIVDIERINREIHGAVKRADNEESLRTYAETICADYSLLKQVARLRRLQVPLFAAGAITQPSDAAYMVEMGCAGVIVSNQVFHTPDPVQRIAAIVAAIHHPAGHPSVSTTSQSVDG